MTLLAELELEHGDLMLTETIRVCPEVEVELEYQTLVDPDEPVVFFSASGDDFDAFDAALARDSTVTDPLVMSSFGARRVYRVRLTDRKKLLSPALADLGGRVFAGWSTDRGWRLRLAVPDRDALVAIRRHCEGEEVAFRLRKLSDFTEEAGEATAGLTDAQREILRLAYDRGYFEEPRRTSLRELADELDISTTAASGRIRRAVARLVENARLDDN